MMTRPRDSLGPMGQITDWFEEYVEGELDRETLVANLAGFDYKTPARFDGIPEDLYEAEAQVEDRTYADEDTFDEVYAGVDRGLIEPDVVVDVMVKIGVDRRVSP